MYNQKGDVRTDEDTWVGFSLSRPYCTCIIEKSNKQQVCKKESTRTLIRVKVLCKGPLSRSALF